MKEFALIVNDLYLSPSETAEQAVHFGKIKSKNVRLSIDNRNRYPIFFEELSVENGVLDITKEHESNNFVPTLDSDKNFEIKAKKFFLKASEDDFVFRRDRLLNITADKIVIEGPSDHDDYLNIVSSMKAEDKKDEFYIWRGNTSKWVKQTVYDSWEMQERAPFYAKPVPPNSLIGAKLEYNESTKDYDLFLNWSYSYGIVTKNSRAIPVDLSYEYEESDTDGYYAQDANGNPIVPKWMRYLEGDARYYSVWDKGGIHYLAAVKQKGKTEEKLFYDPDGTSAIGAVNLFANDYILSNLKFKDLYSSMPDTYIIGYENLGRLTNANNEFKDNLILEWLPVSLKEYRSETWENIYQGFHPEEVLIKFSLTTFRDQIYEENIVVEGNAKMHAFEFVNENKREAIATIKLTSGSGPINFIYIYDKSGTTLKQVRYNIPWVVYRSNDIDLEITSNAAGFKSTGSQLLTITLNSRENEPIIDNARDLNKPIHIHNSIDDKFIDRLQIYIQKWDPAKEQYRSAVRLKKFDVEYSSEFAPQQITIRHSITDYEKGQIIVYFYDYLNPKHEPSNTRSWYAAKARYANIAPLDPIFFEFSDPIPGNYANTMNSPGRITVTAKNLPLNFYRKDFEEFISLADNSLGELDYDSAVIQQIHEEDEFQEARFNVIKIFGAGNVIVQSKYVGKEDTPVSGISPPWQGWYLPNSYKGKYLNLLQYLPHHLRDTDIGGLLKFFDDSINRMFVNASSHERFGMIEKINRLKNLKDARNIEPQYFFRLAKELGFDIGLAREYFDKAAQEHKGKTIAAARNNPEIEAANDKLRKELTEFWRKYSFNIDFASLSDIAVDEATREEWSVYDQNVTLETFDGHEYWSDLWNGDMTVPNFGTEEWWKFVSDPYKTSGIPRIVKEKFKQFTYFPLNSPVDGNMLSDALFRRVMELIPYYNKMKITSGLLTTYLLLLGLIIEIKYLWTESYADDPSEWFDFIKNGTAPTTHFSIYANILESVELNPKLMGMLYKTIERIKPVHHVFVGFEGLIEREIENIKGMIIGAYMDDFVTLIEPEVNKTTLPLD